MIALPGDKVFVRWMGLPIAYMLIISVQFLIAPAAMAQNGPSFDCRKAATATEYLICDEPELWQLDNELSEVYFDLMGQVVGGEARRIRRQQRNWLRDRDRCRDDFACVRRAYLDRIYQLDAMANW